MMSTFRLDVMAAALVLAAGSALASDAPTSCRTNNGTGAWTVTVSDPFEANCAAERCTGMTYTISPHTGLTPDHVALLVEHDAPIVIPSSTFITPPCAGDNLTALGARDCSSQTARINQNQQKVGPFDLVVEGALQPVGGSIVVKKGSRAEQCRIATLGEGFQAFDPEAHIKTSETLEFRQCSLTIPIDPVTGDAGPATLTGENCAFVANGEPVEELSVKIKGIDIGSGKWITDSGFTTGSDSCTTRTVSGRLYSFCDCRSLTDPKPPCP